MPENYRGTGTIFYGKAEKRQDGSFVTTEWIVILFLPIAPIRSLRIKVEAFDTMMWPATKRYRYWIIEKMPIQWARVLRLYAIAWTLVAWWTIAFVHYPRIIAWFGRANEFFTVIGVFVGPLVLLLIYGWIQQRRDAKT